MLLRRFVLGYGAMRACALVRAPSRTASRTALRAATDEAFDGLSCKVFKLDQLATGSQATRLGRFAELKDLAKEFIDRKNSGDLAAIFADLAVGANVYGLEGDAIEPGLTAFFAKHEGLHHEIVGDVTVDSTETGTVSYRFVKSWTEDGARVTWESKDDTKGRDKVEKLVFDEGRLVSAAVVAVDG